MKVNLLWERNKPVFIISNAKLCRVVSEEILLKNNNVVVMPAESFQMNDDGFSD